MDRSEKEELTVSQLRRFVTTLEAAQFQAIVDRAAKEIDREAEEHAVLVLPTRAG